MSLASAEEALIAGALSRGMGRYKIEFDHWVGEPVGGGYNADYYLSGDLPDVFASAEEAEAWLTANHLGPDCYGVDACFRVVGGWPVLTANDLTLLEELADRAPEASLVRQLLEAAHLAARIDAQSRPHDFGQFGDRAYCRRTGCQARNQPPVNRWPCRGDLPVDHQEPGHVDGEGCSQCQTLPRCSLENDEA